MAESIQRLAIYLALPHVENVTDLVKKSNQKSFVEIKLSENKTAMVFYKNAKSEPPKWLDALLFEQNSSVKIKLDQLRNRHCSAVIVVKIETKYFAITLGYGRSMLDLDNFVPNFGKYTALNLLDPNRIRSIDSKEIELGALKSRKQSDLGGNIRTFGIDVEKDLMAAVVGDTKKDVDLAPMVSGSLSLILYKSYKLKDLPKILSKVLKAAQCEDYKMHFDWLDHIVPISNSRTISELETELCSLITNQNFDKIYLAVPEIINWDDTVGFSVRGKDEPKSPTLDIKYYFSQKDIRDKLTPKKLRTYYYYRHLGPQDQTVTHKVFQSIVAEITIKEDLYLLDMGNWYKIDRDFTNKISNAVDQIPSYAGQLPEIEEGEHEEIYLENTAKKNKELTLLDRKNIHWNKNPFEICDLYCSDGTLIHIKRKTRSASLSHLWNQGLNSAELIKMEPEFKKSAEAKLKECGGPNHFEYPLKIVFGITTTSSKKKTSEILPFFSQISLRRTYSRLEALDYRTSIKFIKEAPKN